MHLEAVQSPLLKYKEAPHVKWIEAIRYKPQILQMGVYSLPALIVLREDLSREKIIYEESDIISILGVGAEPVSRVNSSASREKSIEGFSQVKTGVRLGEVGVDRFTETDFTEKKVDGKHADDMVAKMMADRNALLQEIA